MIDVTAATTNELVAFWNEHAPQFGAKPVNRFATRGDAERRVRELIDNIEAHDEPVDDEAPEVTDVAHTDARSAGVARSWQDPEVRAKRSQRTNIRVDGVDYRSVKQAFDALGLPLKEHIPFRQLLKRELRLEAYDRVWEVVL